MQCRMPCDVPRSIVGGEGKSASFQDILKGELPDLFDTKLQGMSMQLFINPPRCR